MRTVRTLRYTPTTALLDNDTTPPRAAWHEIWYRAARQTRLPKHGPSSFLYEF